MRYIFVYFFINVSFHFFNFTNSDNRNHMTIHDNLFYNILFKINEREDRVFLSMFHM